MIYIINFREYDDVCSLIVKSDTGIINSDIINEIRNIYNNNLEKICLENFKKYAGEDEALIKEFTMTSKNLCEWIKQCGISHFFTMYKNEIIEHLYKRFTPADDSIIININTEDL